MIRIKICGVKRTADAAFVADCGADAVGMNFYRKSVRFLTYSEADIIVRSLPPFTAPVGVFAEADIPTIRETAVEHGLRAVQTYALEPDGTDFAPAAHIPAFRVHDRASIADVAAKVETYRRFGRAPAAVLIDSFVPGALGGTGHRAPWDLLAGFDPGVPVILAGGLTPENVAEAIRVVRPWGVDVASGVESSPGVKDPGKVRAFIQAAREAAAGISVEGGSRVLRMTRDTGESGDRGGPR